MEKGKGIEKLFFDLASESRIDIITRAKRTKSQKQRVSRKAGFNSH